MKRVVSVCKDCPKKRSNGMDYYPVELRYICSVSKCQNYTRMQYFARRNVPEDCVRKLEQMVVGQENESRKGMRKVPIL